MSNYEKLIEDLDILREATSNYHPEYKTLGMYVADIAQLIDDTINAIKRLSEENEKLREFQSLFPICDNCKGKTEDGVRTEKCEYVGGEIKCVDQALALAHEYDRLKSKEFIKSWLSL